MRFTTTTNILLATALVQGAALPPGGDQRFPQPGSNGLTNAPGGFRPGGNNDDFGLSSFGQGGRGGGGGGFDDFDDDDLFDDRKIRVRNSLKQRLDHDDDDFDDDDTPAERARERQDDLRDAQEDRLERERERQGRPPVKRAIRVRGSLKKRDNDDDEDDSPAERAREREDDARERADDRLDDLRDAQDDQLERERERQWRQNQGRRQGGRGAPVRKRFDVSDALGDAGDGAEDAFQDGLREVGGLFGGRKMRRGDDGVDDFDDDVDDFQRGGGAGRFGAPQGLGQGRGFGPQGFGQGGRRQGGRGGFDDFDDDQFDDRKKN